MIFDVNRLAHELSQHMELELGDLILSGTPEGVALSGWFPYFTEGDVVEFEISGLCRQRQTYVQQATAGSCTRPRRGRK